MTYITGTINLKSLICRRDFLSLPWREFILFTVFTGLELIFLP